MFERLKNTLTYTDVEIIKGVSKELEGGNNIVVLSDVSRSLNIARTSMYRPLDMLQAVGIIDKRSLGVKGTYIKIIDKNALNEIVR